MKSTLPSWITDSRTFDTDSTKSTLPSMLSPKMPLAMALATSTSKPCTWPVVGFLRPNSGWSNLVPTVILPFFWSVSMVEPAGKVGAFLVVVAEVAESFLLLLPHAPATSASARTEARAPHHLRCLVIVVPFIGASVTEDLREEVARPVRGRVLEEVVGGGGLDDAAGVHEHHPASGRA